MLVYHPEQNAFFGGQCYGPCYVPDNTAAFFAGQWGGLPVNQYWGGSAVPGNTFHASPYGASPAQAFMHPAMVYPAAGADCVEPSIGMHHTGHCGSDSNSHEGEQTPITSTESMAPSAPSPQSIPTTTACGATSKKKSKSKRKSGKQALQQQQLPSCTNGNQGRSESNLGTEYDMAVWQKEEHCKEIITELGNEFFCHTRAFARLLPVAKDLALLKHGTRVIQKAIEVGSSQERSLLVEKIAGHIEALYKSPHGNHVLAKLIEVMPPDNLGFLIDELHKPSDNLGQPRVLTVVKHQYGCRLLERLLEHCRTEQVAGLVEMVLADAEPLCRNPFGNFVMQHLFEHGSQAWKASIAAQIVDAVPQLAKHRTASHVVQRALEFGGEEIQQSLVSALVMGVGEYSLVEVGCSRYGSFVVEELASIQACNERVRQLLQEGISRLEESPYGKRVISKFGFPPSTSKSLPSGFQTWFT